MLQQLFKQINWQAPWYRTLTIVPCQTVVSTEFSHVKDWLNTASILPIYNYQNKPIQFVAQDDLPADTAYETFIAQTGQIPTRDNFHDLLGGLIWLNFPSTKTTFNQLHQQDIEQNGIQPNRSVLRNILTLFDENGGIVVSSDKSVLHDLQCFNWQSALFDKKLQWLSGRTQFFPFGHALLEKLIEPRKNITAHVLLLYVKDDFFCQTIEQQRHHLDKLLSQFFNRLATKTTLTSKLFQPLPVLGIPNFCNIHTLDVCQDIDFYKDWKVFRLPRNAPPSPLVDVSAYS